MPGDVKVLVPEDTHNTHNTHAKYTDTLQIVLTGNVTLKIQIWIYSNLGMHMKMTVSINLVIVLPISDLAPPKHDMTVSCFFHLAIVHLYLDYLRKAAQLIHVYDSECQQQQRRTLVHTY